MHALQDQDLQDLDEVELAVVEVRDAAVSGAPSERTLVGVEACCGAARFSQLNPTPPVDVTVTFLGKQYSVACKVMRRRINMFLMPISMRIPTEARKDADKQADTMTGGVSALKICNWDVSAITFSQRWTHGPIGSVVAAGGCRLEEAGALRGKRATVRGDEGGDQEEEGGSFR
jgi:hypothetical protein